MDMIGIHNLFESASDEYLESFIERLESKIDRSELTSLDTPV